MRIAKRLPAVLAVWTFVLPGTTAEADDDGDEDHDEGEDSSYGKRGTFELGGDVAASWTDEVRTISLSPTFGYFIVDRVELSVDLGFLYVKPDDGESSKAGTLVVEPSYHHPIAENLMLLGGLGIGSGWDGDDFDFELIPRVGLNVLTGRSNVITPSIEVPILIGEAHGENGDVGTSVGVLFEIGITTTW